MSTSLRLARCAIFLAVAGAACSSSSPIEQPPPPAEQARLVPWTLEADGLPPVTRGILDRRENVVCKFAPAADGRLRCLPDTSAMLDTSVFTDAACTQLAYAAPGPVGHLMTVPLPRVACDAQRFEVRRVRALPEGQALFHTAWADDGPHCMPAAAAGVLVATEVVPPESWVAGDEADGARLSDRLRVTDIATSDGARFADHLIDDHWNQTCTLEGDRCWPPFLEENWRSLFSDDKCTSPIFAQADPCATPTLLRGSSGGDLFAVGPRWAGPVFRGTKGCFLEGSANATDGPFTKGGRLDADAVAGARIVQHGTGRLQGYGLRARADGEITPLPRTLLPYQRFRDTTTGGDCEPVWTREGQIRCLPVFTPNASADVPIFADAACTQPAFFCNIAPTCADQVVVTSVFDDRGEQRDAELHAGVHDPENAQRFVRQGSACVPYGDPVPQLSYWTTDLPWDDYPLLREKNGPAAR
jgi:hypothetical protein